MRSLGSIWSCLGVIVLLFLMKIKAKKKFDQTAAAQRRQVSTTLTLLGLRRARARVMRVGAGIAGHVRLVASMRAHVRADECCARMTLPRVALILPGDQQPDEAPGRSLGQIVPLGRIAQPLDGAGPSPRHTLALSLSAMSRVSPLLPTIPFPFSSFSFSARAYS